MLKLKRWLNEAESMREADAKKKDAVQAKNDGENLVYTVEKQLNDLKEKISDGDKDDLNAKIKELKDVLESGELETIQEKHKTLQEASWKVTQSAYQNNSDSNTEGEKKEEEKKEE